MKSWISAFLLALLTLGAPACVNAQHGERGGQPYRQAGRERAAPPPHAGRYDDARGAPSQAWRTPPPPPAYGRAYGYGPPPVYGQPYYPAMPRYTPPIPGRWRRGQFLPPAYRGFAIADYARYHLRRPPRGYYWCRSGDDFILVATASGLIFDVINGDD